MKRLFVCLSIMLPILSFGQKRGESLTVREWEKGPLRKEEFTVSPQGDSAYFSVIWLEKTARVKVGSAIYQYFDVQNAFLPGNTVIAKEGLTEDLLKSFQEQFDLSEFCTRKLRDAYLMTPGWKRKDLRSRAFEKFTLLRDNSHSTIFLRRTLILPPCRRSHLSAFRHLRERSVLSRWGPCPG